jgi:hypothetical protein
MRKPKYLQLLHIIGFLLVIAGAFVGGLQNPAIGIYVVIAFLVIGLEILNLPPVNVNTIPFVIGSVRYGGIRRGVALGWGFTAAVIYLTVFNFLIGLDMVAYSNLLLVLGIVISNIALEIYIFLLKRFYRTEKTG